MLMMQELRQCGFMWMRDNIAPPTSPTLTWSGSRDQLWWQPMMLVSPMRIGRVYRAYSKASRLRTHSKWGGLGLGLTLSTISQVNLVHGTNFLFIFICMLMPRDLYTLCGILT